MKKLKKYSYPLCLTGLFMIAFFLRAYRLGELPNVLEVDEVGLGYNAWCLANYGVDRYLNEWPIYPQNYVYSGQSPLYTYSLVLQLKLFPVKELTPGLIRIPILISSMLAVICFTKTISYIFKNKKITLAGTALITFCPYFIMSGRYALDCNMMLGTSVLAITLLLHYLEKPTWSSLLCCGGSFALVLYSYVVSYIVLPIFLVTISVYLLYTKRINIGRLLVLAGEIFILALPLILFVICLIFKLPGFRFLGIQILPIGEGRVAELAQTGFWASILNCIEMTLTNSPIPLDSVDKFYTMYIVSIPFIVLGFICSFADFLRSIVKRYFTFSSIFLLYTAAILIGVGLTGESFYIYRANAIFVCYLYFCIIGIRSILYFLRNYRKACKLAVCFAYAVWTVAFVRYYYTMYSVADIFKYPNSYYFIPEEDAFSFILENQDEKEVYIDCFFEEYFFFYYPVSPYAKENTNWSASLSIPPKTSSIYMVHKGNQDFITQLQNSGLPYKTTEFTYYYVFEIP